MTKKIGLAAAASFMLIATSPIQAQETSPFVGNWSGEWDHRKGSGQLNELNIRAVDADGRITALYCYERPNGFGSYFELEPGGMESSIDGNVLRFKNGWGRFRYTLTDDDTLRLRQSRKGKVAKMTMSRQAPSGCAARITAPEPN